MSHDTGVLNLIRNGRLANAVEKNRVNEEWEREREGKEDESKMVAVLNRVENGAT